MYSFMFRAGRTQFFARLRLRASDTYLVAIKRFAFSALPVLGVVSVATSGFAQQYHANTVSYGAGGYVFANEVMNFSGADFQHNFGEDVAGGVPIEPASLKGVVSASVGSDVHGATASNTLEGFAGAGILRCNLFGYLSATTGTFPQRSDADLNVAYVQARWQDTFKVGNSFDPHSGRKLHIKAHLILDGGIDIEVSGQPISNNGYAISNVRLRLVAQTALAGDNPILENALPPAPYGGYFAEGTDSTNPTFVEIIRPAMRIIPLDIIVRENRFHTMDFLMEVRATGGASVLTHSSLSNSFSTTFSGDFGHTLRWGGITSVTDDLTGEPIEGWTITAASGVDYAHEIVPEPASLGLVLMGLLGMACRRTPA